MEEERAERQRFRDAEEAGRRRNFEWMQELRRSGFRKVGHWQTDISVRKQGVRTGNERSQWLASSKYGNGKGRI